MNRLIDPNRIHATLIKQLWAALKKATLQQLPSELSSHTHKATYPVQRQVRSDQPTFKIRVLKLVPYVLVIAFLISFGWDFPNQSVFVLDQAIRLDGLLRTLAVSGLIGYGTNWIAVTMLFKPIQKRPLLGQGLIPAQKTTLAIRLANTIANELLSVSLIQEKIKETKIIESYTARILQIVEKVTQNIEFRTELKALLTNYLTSFFLDNQRRTQLAKLILEALQESLKEKKLEHLALQTYLLVRGKDAHEIIDLALAGIPSRLDHLFDNLNQEMDKWPASLKQESENIEVFITNIVSNLLNKLEIRAFVEDNLNRYDEQRFEKLIKNATHDQLVYIQYLGGVLGVIGGLVIWSPILSLAAILFMMMIFFGLDWLIYQYQSIK